MSDTRRQHPTTDHLALVRAMMKLRKEQDKREAVPLRWPAHQQRHALSA